MAVVVSARAHVAPLASIAVLSAARGGTVATRITGLADLAGVWLAIAAVSGGPPATYADMSPDIGSSLNQAPAAQAISWDEGAGEYSVSLSYPIGTTVFAEGDEVWLAVFIGGAFPPAPSETPEATAGPVAVVA